MGAMADDSKAVFLSRTTVGVEERLHGKTQVWHYQNSIGRVPDAAITAACRNSLRVNYNAEGPFSYAGRLWREANPAR